MVYYVYDEEFKVLFSRWVGRCVEEQPRFNKESFAYPMPSAYPFCILLTCWFSVVKTVYRYCVEGGEGDGGGKKEVLILVQQGWNFLQKKEKMCIWASCCWWSPGGGGGGGQGMD